MEPYVTTRRDAIDFLSNRLSSLMADVNSPVAIRRAMAKEYMPKVETVLQWLETLEGEKPVFQIFTVLGNVRILDEEADYKPIMFNVENIIHSELTTLMVNSINDYTRKARK